MDRRTKEKVVAELHEKLKETKLAVLTGYVGLNVEKMMALRNVLRRSGAELHVVKNTLLRIASKDTALSTLEEHFRGPLALVLNRGDVVEPTKVLIDFAKKNAELEIKAGVLDGKFLSKEQIGLLSELPTREVLLGKFLSVLVGVQTALVRVLSGVPRNFVQVLGAYQMKKQSGN
ncbi:MAG: 50S ribosomal protein L10 [Deltaproteobacteria bacterium]|nr:50S ribosomal protein L10 [Deltaproteobacteria bacterium]